MKAALLWVLAILLVSVAAGGYRFYQSFVNHKERDTARLTITLFNVIEALIRHRPYAPDAVSRITETTLRALDSNKYFATFMSDREAKAPLEAVELRMPTPVSTKTDGLVILSVNTAARIKPEAVTKHFGPLPDLSVPEPAAPYEFAYRYKYPWGDLSFEFARRTRYLKFVAIDAIEGQPTASIGATTMAEDATVAPRPTGGEKWLDTFAAYPGARELCSQHVTGNVMHILWHAYVSRDIPEKVIAFYVQAEGKEHVEQGQNSLSVRHGDKVLSIHSTAAKDYPDCGKSPRPEEKTIMIVSQAIRATHESAER